jgi:hypothetical protein
MSTTVPVQSSKAADSFEEQLVGVVAKQPKRMFVPLLLSVVLIAGMASRTAPVHWILLWLALATAVMAGRILIQTSARLAPLTARTRLQITIGLVGASGITHGLSLCFFFAMSPFEQAVLSMMLVGLAAGSVATAAGIDPFSWPTSSPRSARLRLCGP